MNVTHACIEWGSIDSIGNLSSAWIARTIVESPDHANGQPDFEKTTHFEEEKPDRMTLLQTYITHLQQILAEE